MEKAEIVAMAVAVIAEELGTDVKKARIVSFKESNDSESNVSKIRERSVFGTTDKVEKTDRKRAKE